MRISDWSSDVCSSDLLHGTRALIDRMAVRGIRPDFCLVGEPTSVARLGDTIKIGRRGSVNIWIDVPGQKGHVASPHLDANPITRLIAILAASEGHTLDTGTDAFQHPPTTANRTTTAA